MDELPPIRNLSLTQQRIRDALKNAPPLTINKRSKEDFIVFDNKNKSNENSLINRLNTHKTIGSNNGSESETNKTGNKWSQLKDKIDEELENKRIESQKFRDINHKIENEELDDELEDELTKDIEKDIEDNYGENEKVSQNKQNNGSEEQIEKEEEEVEDEEEHISESEGEDIDESEGEDIDESEGEDIDENEDEECERKQNPFVDDEAEDEDIEEVDQKLEIHSDDSRESFAINSYQKKRPIVEECNEDIVLNDVLDTSYSVLDESFDRKCATQKIALSPFITQKPRPRFDSKHDFSELISDLNSNNEEFNSQSLLDLCSGDFTANARQISSQTEAEPEESQTNNSDDGQSEHNSDIEDAEEDTELLSRSKKSAKVFNIESDAESDSEDNGTDLKNTEEIKTSLKNFNGSDGEDLIVTDEEEYEEQTEDSLKQLDVNAFFENEAELSGSEASSDEEDDDEEDHEEEEAEQEDLPSDEEIEAQNQKYFNKQLLDEEKRNIMILKERLFEDGDLHDGAQRQKKFRWNFDTDEDFVNDYINDDSDDNYMDSDEDEKTKTPTLKMFDVSPKMETKQNHNLEKLKSNLKKNFDFKNTKNISEMKNSSISAFVVRDERLKTVMAFGSKRSKPKNSFKSNKRLKGSKNETKASVFDLLDTIN